MKIKFSSGNLQLGGNFAQTSNKISVYVWKIHTTDDAILHRLINKGHFMSNADRSGSDTLVGK